jgi:hypothetical protein
MSEDVNNIMWEIEDVDFTDYKQSEEYDKVMIEEWD